MIKIEELLINAIFKGTDDNTEAVELANWLIDKLKSTKLQSLAKKIEDELLEKCENEGICPKCGNCELTYIYAGEQSEHFGAPVEEQLLSKIECNSCGWSENI